MVAPAISGCRGAIPVDATERAMTIARLAQEHAESIRAIFAANDDLGGRLEAAKKDLVYDPDDDYFAIMIDGPAEAITESFANSIVFRVEPGTLKILGIEIYDFEKRRAGAPGPWAPMVEYWAPVVEALRAGDDPEEALRMVVDGRSIRELVPA
jgi:hypothetical protein